jgi:hypothetical protein
MLDERVESVPAELRHQAFNNKAIWQRAAITLDTFVEHFDVAAERDQRDNKFGTVTVAALPE